MADLTKQIGMSSMEAQDQRVETMILEPTAFSQSQARFLLPQQGLLSEDAFLQFKVSAPAGQDAPFSAGALSCIQRAAIYYDNTLLAETDQAGILLNLKQYFVDQDIRNQTYQTKTGGFTGMKVDEANTAPVNTRGHFMPEAPRQGAAAYNSGLVGLKTEENTPGAINVIRNNAFALSNVENDSPEWTVPLAWLFNFISQLQIPLGLLNGRISLQIDWAEDLVGLRTVSSADPTGGFLPWTAGSVISEASCKLSVDLIYYDDMPGKVSPMERIQAQLEKGIELVYTDYIQVEEFIPALAAAPANTQVVSKTIRLNLDHQIVRNLLLALPRQAEYGGTGTPAVINGMDASNPILGDFNSGASMGETTLQVKINNQNLFVNALDMDCKIFNELSQVLPTPFKANVGLTSNVGQVSGAALEYNNAQIAFPNSKYIMGHRAGGLSGLNIYTEGMCGSAGFMGVNLSRTYDNVLGAGTSIGKAPVEIDLTYTYTLKKYRQRRVVVFAEVERMMMIKNGTIYVSGS
jgi:hypothetical protein